MPKPPQNQSVTRVGKIAQLPGGVRDELNRRLLNGQLSPLILPWLNELPEVKSVIDERFKGEPVNAQNISDWRKGGFRDWMRSNERIEQTKSMSELATYLARANGGKMSDGALSIVGGHILSVLEQTGGVMAPESLGELVKAVVSIKSAEIAQQRADQDKEKIAQTDKQFALEKEKFERLVCGKLLDAAMLAKAQEIASGTGTNEEKIAKLRQTYFSDVDALEASGEVQFPKN